jgi:hypothetical protein
MLYEKDIGLLRVKCHYRHPSPSYTKKSLCYAVGGIAGVYCITNFLNKVKQLILNATVNS